MRERYLPSRASQLGCLDVTGPCSLYAHARRRVKSRRPAKNTTLRRGKGLIVSWVLAHSREDRYVQRRANMGSSAQVADPIPRDDESMRHCKLGDARSKHPNLGSANLLLQ